jgi:hypothetical protein
MKQKYLITGEELRSLLYMANKCMALESGGVDNWEWYSGSIQDYLNDMTDEYEVDKFSDLDDIADFELKQYERDKV